MKTNVGKAIPPITAQVLLIISETRLMLAVAFEKNENKIMLMTLARNIITAAAINKARVV